MFDALNPNFVIAAAVDGAEFKPEIADMKVDDTILVISTTIDGKSVELKSDFAAVQVALNQMINKRNEIARLDAQREAQERQMQNQKAKAEAENK